MLTELECYIFSLSFFNLIQYTNLMRIVEKAWKNKKPLYICSGKSYTTSSLLILQGGNAAKVRGCSGAM